MRPQVQDRAKAARLQQVCAELARRLSAGENYRSEQVFESDPDLALDVDSVLEVVYTEFVTRDHLGHRPSPAEFLARFPQFHGPLGQLFEVHGALGDDGKSRSGHDGLRSILFDALLRAQGQEPGPGRRVGNYELLEEIGRGGMGVVYRARQVGLNRFVALKMIVSGLDAGPRDRARLRAEAEAAAQLQHPGIVQIHEVGEHEGHPFLVFEYLAGGNLERRIGGKPSPATSAARLVESVALAVQHAHDHGIIHRDLKPANILLQSPEPTILSSQSKGDQLGIDDPRIGTLKISDFGLARQLAADNTTPRAGLTVTGTIIGTPAYMAPEQAVTGSVVGPATDVYSLGAILFELLTGRPPFQGLSVLDTLDQVRSRDPVPPSRLLPGVPRDLETICLKCLRKEPRQRYASATDLGADLGRFLRGEPIHARPTSLAERAWKWAKRRPAISGLLATMAIVLLVGIVVVAVSWQRTAAALVTVRNERNEKEAALASAVIALAHRDWLANDLDAARIRLIECPPAYRDVQWRYLDRACNSRLLVIPNETHSTAGAVGELTWSPNGRLVAAAHVAGVVRVCDLTTGHQVYSLSTGRVSLMRQAAFLPNNRIVTVSTPALFPVAGPGKRATATMIEVNVRHWDATSGRELSGSITSWPPTLGHVSGDGRYVVGCYGKQLIVTDCFADPISSRSIDLAVALPLILLKQAVSHDGRLLAAQAGRKITVLDKLSASTAGPTIEFTDGNPTHFVFSPDGSQLAISVFDPVRNKGTVSVRDIRTSREVLMLAGHTLPVDCLAYSPDGKRLATGGSDKMAILWDVQTGREIVTFRALPMMLTAVAFSPDGARLATAHRDGSIHIWDTRQLDER